MRLVLDVYGLSIRMAHSLLKTPTCEGEAGVSLLAETPVVPAPHSGETDGVLSTTALRVPPLRPRRDLTPIPQAALTLGPTSRNIPDQHGPERPVPLAVDQEFGEGWRQWSPGD
jgi:hypothetical protein